MKRYLLLYEIPFGGGNIRGHCFADIEKLTEESLTSWSASIKRDCEVLHPNYRFENLLWRGVVKLDDA